MLWLAVAVLLGLVLIAFAVDYGIGLLVLEARKIVLLLSRDVQERSEERLVHVDHLKWQERESERERKARLGL